MYNKYIKSLIFFAVIAFQLIVTTKSLSFDFYNTTDRLKSYNIVGITKLLKNISLNQPILNNILLPLKDVKTIAKDLFESELFQMGEACFDKADIIIKFQKTALLNSSANYIYLLEPSNVLYVAYKYGKNFVDIAAIDLNDPLVLSNINLAQLQSYLVPIFRRNNLKLMENTLINLIRASNAVAVPTNMSYDARHELVNNLLNILIQKYEKLSKSNPLTYNPKIKYLKQNKAYILLNILNPVPKTNILINIAKVNTYFANLRYDAYLFLKSTIDASLSDEFRNLSFDELNAVYEFLYYNSPDALNKVKNSASIYSELANRNTRNKVLNLCEQINEVANVNYEFSAKEANFDISLYDQLKAKMIIWFTRTSVIVLITQIVLTIVIGYIVTIVLIRLITYGLKLVKRYTMISKDLISVSESIGTFSKIINKIGANNIATLLIACILCFMFVFMWIIITSGRKFKPVNS